MFRELPNYHAVVPEYVKGIRHVHNECICGKEKAIIVKTGRDFVCSVCYCLRFYVIRVRILRKHLMFIGPCIIVIVEE